MPFSSKAVANYFLDIANARGQSLTPMKLQKLVFFAHGWHLALADKPLISESVKAWSYGPVIGSLYHEFKEFGNGSITRKATDEQIIDSEGFRVESFEPSIRSGSTLLEFSGNDAIDAEVAKAIADRVYSVYGKFGALQLSDMTHEEWSPWRVVE